MKIEQRTWAEEKCVITGIKPEVAQAMIHLNLAIASFPSQKNLRAGLIYGLNKPGYEVTSQ